MGCAACIKNPKVQQPIDLSHQIQSIKKTVNKLIFCRLIPQKQFNSMTNHLISQAIARSNALLQQQPPSVSRQQISSGKSWQLFILCRNLDLYNPKYDQLSEYTHNCFGQIIKDLHRTFPLHEPLKSTTETFEKVLKRLALYFPKLGYTQGINFIVGFQLIQGLTESETFWNTVHLFLNPDFCMLGLYQDGFPLSIIYCRLFDDLLRIYCPEIHSKFQTIGVANEAWIFKWFMSYYLYSFEPDTVRHIWNYIVVVGGLGVIYFAIALVIKLQDQLLNIDTDFQILNYFAGLRQARVFQSCLKLPDVINLAYQIMLSDDQIAHSISQLNKTLQCENFYFKYFSAYNQDHIKHKVVRDWHKQIQEIRLNFQKYQKKPLTQDVIVQNKVVHINTNHNKKQTKKFRVKKNDKSSVKVVQTQPDPASNTITNQYIVSLSERVQKNSQNEHQQIKKQRGRLIIRIISSARKNKKNEENNDPPSLIDLNDQKSINLSKPFKKKKNPENTQYSKPNKFYKRKGDKISILTEVGEFPKIKLQMLDDHEHVISEVLEFEYQSSNRDSISSNMRSLNPQHLKDGSLNRISVVEEHEKQISIEIVSVHE